MIKSHPMHDNPQEEDAPASQRLMTCHILKMSSVLPAILAVLLYFNMQNGPDKTLWPLLLLVLSIAGYAFGAYLEYKGKRRNRN